MPSNIARGTAVAQKPKPVRSVLVALVTVVLLAAAVSTHGRPQDAKTEPETKTFEVVARRFAFEPATIEVTEGDRVKLLVRSADGPHGVEIKQFKVKKAVPRAKPGDSPVEIQFTASTAGKFPILCSEYCGNGHEDMTGTLVVHIKSKEPNETPN